MQDNDNAVMVRQESSGMMSVKQVADRVNAVHQILENVMKPGTHFGTVPGCGDKKVLLKPGADLLAMTFRLVPQFKVERTDLPDGHREFDVTCSMFNPAGELLGQGVGSASTMEKKYRYRWDGSGKDRKQVENPDIADVYNTVLKMAKKRAHVDATLTVTGAADLFTQDLIDEEDAKPAPAMPQRKSETTHATPPPPKNDDRPPDREPANEAGADDQGETELHGVVKLVTRKPGKSARGEYVKCGVCVITDKGEQWANTFDTKLADDAESLKGHAAILYVKQGKFGLDLVGIGQ
jgi:hypothetical protein